MKRVLLTLNVTNCRNGDVLVKLRPIQRMYMLMTAYCDHQGYNYSEMTFKVDKTGKLIKPWHTPERLGLVEGDCIIAINRI